MGKIKVKVLALATLAEGLDGALALAPASVVVPTTPSIPDTRRKMPTTTRTDSPAS